MNGTTLQALRKKAGLTQRQLAEALGLKGPNIARRISAWETNRHGMSAITAQAITQFLTSKSTPDAS